MRAIWVHRLVTLAVASCLGVLAAISLAWNLGLSLAGPGFTGGLLDDPAQTWARLSDDLAEGRFELSGEYQEQFRAAAHRDPLSDAPFLLKAIDSSEQGRFREALVRLEQARTRNPRNRFTRILLFDAYLRAGRAGGVVTEAVALDRLRTGSTQKLLPVLVSLAENPSTRREATRTIGGSPLEYPILRALAEQQVSPDLLMSFTSRPMEENSLDEKAKQQISGLIDPYLKAGKWSEAAGLWMHFYARRPAELGRVVDPGFTGNLGPPFGWQIGKSDGGLTEQEGKGLQIIDFGRKKWEVARQALLLRPGTYRLHYKLNDEPADAPDLAWRVDCAASGKNLLDLPFQSKNFLGMVATDRFTVPADNCPAQWLFLVSRGGAAGETRSVFIRSADISQLGGN